ncbi:MAG: calcium-binding protein, partial [Pseudomonadota bacterium]
SGDDVVNGGDGNDQVYGDAGNDRLTGGAGTDNLNGGTGNDTYVFGRGWGQDVINSYDATAGKTDVIEFAVDIAPADIKATRSGDDLILSLAGSTDKVTVSSYFQQDGSGAYKVEQIRFADGTSWDVNTVKTLVMQGSSGADTLYGYVTDDTLDAGEGNDSLYGRAGNDTLGGGGGNDWVYGEDGNDTLDGGAGTDYVYGGSGDDVVNGGDGNDQVYGDAGNDRLTGGAGTDNLNGGTGNDTYLFGRGWGQDTINNYDATAGKTDAIEFAADIAPADIRVTRNGDSLILCLVGSTDKITVSSYFHQDGASAYKVEQIRFADGTSWDVNTVKTLVMQGSSGADTLYGYATDDVLDAAEGNDYLYGKAGNDTLSGAAGDDWVYGDDGNDAVDGGAGTDYLNGGNGDDAITGGEGNDQLSGDAGNDRLTGGAGTDNLNGGAGNDTYLFGRGAGTDAIGEYDTTPGNSDSLSFEAGISTDQLWFRRVGYDLEVSIIGTTDKVTVGNWYSGSAYHVEQFKSGDGKTLLDTQVQNLVDAMAGFAPPAAGQTTLPDNYRSTLDPVLATNWQ